MDDNNSSESKDIEVQLTNEETGGDEGATDTGRTLKLNKSNDSEAVAETADEGDDGSEGSESAEGVAAAIVVKNDGSPVPPVPIPSASLNSRTNPLKNSSTWRAKWVLRIWRVRASRTSFLRF